MHAWKNLTLPKSAPQNPIILPQQLNPPSPTKAITPSPVPNIPEPNQNSTQPPQSNQVPAVELSPTTLTDIPITTSDPFNLGPLLKQKKPRRSTKSSRGRGFSKLIPNSGKRKLPPSLFFDPEQIGRPEKKQYHDHSISMEEDTLSAETAVQSRRVL
ncbi:UNVERIFIED_CONTAM: hypothetical protein Sradi_5377800 [Sesamum radiatum]|uniref:Uncharacterized protein n=1 Tax=Sesamum radiatum TaxID=300843 RepID=A0AAW2LR70_SESRA